MQPLFPSNGDKHGSECVRMGGGLISEHQCHAGRPFWRRCLLEAILVEVVGEGPPQLNAAPWGAAGAWRCCSLTPEPHSISLRPVEGGVLLI